MSVRVPVPGFGAGVIEADATPFRLLALGSALALLGVFIFELYSVTVIVGGTWWLAAVVAVALLLATVLAVAADERTAAVVTGVLLFVGAGVYFVSVTEVLGAVSSMVGLVLGDTLALMTGVSVLRIHEAAIWAVAVAPLPVFLTWYLALTRRYAFAGAVGGSMVLFFALTGDLGMVATMFGVLAVLCVLGFGELERRGGTSSQVDLLILLLAVMAISGLFVTVIPAENEGGISGTPMGDALGFSGDGGDSSLEGSLVSDDGEVSISGSPELSPELRFTVEADEPRRWRVETYNRYTGEGWLNSLDDETPFDGEIAPPEGPTKPVEQSYEFHVSSDSMPAAAQPVAVQGSAAEITLVREDGTISLGTAFEAGDTYGVESAAHISTSAALNASGTEYPAGIEETHTQVPGSTPDRVTELTDEITADAETPYETALSVEQFLQRKDYSLDVDEPSGDIADQFLFEMEAGYCTYFATTMATMLRTQDIPTRMVTGYNTGQELDDGKYLVRGSDAHAWVEVYFEGIGWVEFDPTPAADWDDARSSAVMDARLDDDIDVDIDIEESEGEPYINRTDEDPFDQAEQEGPDDGGFLDTERNPGLPDAGSQQSENLTDLPDGIAGVDEDDSGAADIDVEEEDDRVAAALSWLRDVLPSGEQLTIALALVVGTAAGARSTGMTTKTRETITLYWQRPGTDPDADAKRAADRLERHLERTYRPRRPTESRAEYLDTLPRSIDDRTETVFSIAERATYGDGVTREAANEAIEIADAVVTSSVPVIGRFR